MVPTRYRYADAGGSRWRARAMSLQFKGVFKMFLIRTCIAYHDKLRPKGTQPKVLIISSVGFDWVRVQQKFMLQSS